MTRRGEASICFCATYTSQGYMTLLAPLKRSDDGEIIIIKGGSQGARSKMMEQVANDLLERGFSLEIYRHWVDPTLISGFRLISPAMMVIDEELGEPVCQAEASVPSVIIDIGPAWDHTHLKYQRKALCTLTWQTSRRLLVVASYLKELGIILQERKSYVSDSMDFAAVDWTTQRTVQEIFTRDIETTLVSSSPPLFVSAITANGLDHCVNTLVSGYKHFFLLRGEPGTGRSTVLARVSEQAAKRGLITRSFYGPLEPDHLELLLIPSIATALVSGNAVHRFRPNDHRQLASLKVVELGEAAKKKRLSLFHPEWLSSIKRFNDLMELTTKQLSICKQTNETITAIYQEYVNQGELDFFTAALLQHALETIDCSR